MVSELGIPEYLAHLMEQGRFLVREEAVRIPEHCHLSLKPDHVLEDPWSGLLGQE